ncbi:MAG: ABC transporter permease, partial [Bacteroidales bacterium]|nr:ABC transporter permease [Bacteroidales bacterium]
MFIHYIKVALRNLIKFKTQTILSIIGLAIGFACFALSVTWIRYEMSFDTFHPNGDRIYAVNATQNGAIVKSLLTRPLIEHFQKTFPEVELATMVEYGKLPIGGDKTDTCIYFLETDSAFYQMFPFPFESDLYHQPTATGAYPMVVTRGTAKLLKGKKGSNGAIFNQREIVGTMKEFPVNSRFHCNAIATIVPPPQVPEGGGYSRDFIHAPLYMDFFVQLKEGSHAEDFAKKISSLYYQGDTLHFTLVPLNELHYRLPDPNTSYKFSHIILFAGAGALVILCALFNYITLFVTRISIRGREIALRKVNGASNGQLILLFAIEFLILIFIALFIGECLVELCIPKFITLSGILLTRGAIYVETIVYAILLLLISFIVGIIPICYFRSKTLQANIQSQTGPARNLFRKATLILQLIISIGLFFATTVLFKQVHYMTNEGSGFDSRNVWYAEMNDYNVYDYADKIAQIPYVTEISKEYSGFFPGYGVARVSSSTGSLCMMHINRDFIRFHKLKVLAGEPFKDGEKDVIMINESMLKLQENETRESIIGKYVMYGNVVGVISNYYSGLQTEEQEPVIFFPAQEKMSFVSMLYRVMDGKAKEANAAIRTLL